MTTKPPAPMLSSDVKTRSIELEVEVIVVVETSPAASEPESCSICGDELSGPSYPVRKSYSASDSSSVLVREGVAAPDGHERLHEHSMLSV